MITVNQAKSMAKILRADLEARDHHASHSETLEIVSHQLGYKDWNTFHAAAERRARHLAPVPDDPQEPNSGGMVWAMHRYPGDRDVVRAGLLSNAQTILGSMLGVAISDMTVADDTVSYRSRGVSQPLARILEIEPYRVEVTLLDVAPGCYCSIELLSGLLGTRVEVRIEGFDPGGPEQARLSNLPQHFPRSL